MKPIQKITTLFFQNNRLREKLKVKEDVQEDHRGIMHSPTGILISSFFLTLILSVFLIILGLFNFTFLILVFLGLFIGQLLHLLQDSCTIKGIDWKFPFGKNIINGGINTLNKEDIRPKLYSTILGILTLSIFLGYIFNKINNISLLVVYPTLIIIISLLWFLFIKMSKQCYILPKNI